MNIIRYVGLYLLIGFVLHMGWTIIFEIWINHKVGSKNFPDAIVHYLWLKEQLYDKHAILQSVKVAMEEMLSNGFAFIILGVLLTTIIWPISVCEDLAVYSDMCEYVYDVAREKENSES
jgi:hypothetical protein